MPRAVLWLFCLAYLIPGYVGRDAWKGADVAALGWMTELANGNSQWLHPTLAGLPPDNPSLLPYWLGAWALQWCPGWMAPDFAARIPFALLLGFILLVTWHATYCLARTPRAQPVAFAFGGEPPPKEYASAIADGALLALIASLGLAQPAHETSPALVQLACVAMLLHALAAMPWHTRMARLVAVLAQCGMVLSGAPALALLLSLGGVAVYFLDRSPRERDTYSSAPTGQSASLLKTGVWIAAGMVISALLAAQLHLWRWKISIPSATWNEWNGIAQLLIWFTWPAWPLAFWTVWRWRRQLFQQNPSCHLLLPLWFVAVITVTAIFTNEQDRTLLLALPAFAALASFALPTLKRQVAALIDWFTLLFFSGCGIIIWVVWIAMQTGFPSQPSANVARLAPGFVASFSATAFFIAMAATLVWAWLVKWRVGRHRAAIWKSLVLPAGGAALCWLLLMTLWMPLLNYAQSYNMLVKHTLERATPATCILVQDLGAGKTAAFEFYGNVQLRQNTPSSPKECAWLIAEPGPDQAAPDQLDTSVWQLMAAVNHPTDGNESVLLFRRR